MGRSEVFRKGGKLALFSQTWARSSAEEPWCHRRVGGCGIRVDVDTLEILIQVHDVVPFDNSRTCYVFSVNPQNSLQTRAQTQLSL